MPIHGSYISIVLNGLHNFTGLPFWLWCISASGFGGFGALYRWSAGAGVPDARFARWGGGAPACNGRTLSWNSRSPRPIRHRHCHSPDRHNRQPGHKRWPACKKRAAQQCRQRVTQEHLGLQDQEAF